MLTASRIALVADDEPMVYETLCAALKRRGFAVQVATTTPEALELVGASRYDLVVSDYFMPGGAGGRDVLSACLNQSDRPKVIMVTGMGNTDVVDELMAAGADCCLGKPFGVREFLAIVDEVCAN